MSGARSPLGACQVVGRGVRVHGRAFIENLGRVEIGDDVVLHATPVAVHLDTAPGCTLAIGDRVAIAHGVGITAHAGVTIGADSRIGPYSMVLDTDFHGVEDRDGRPEAQAIRIGRGVRLGAHVTVLRGTELGDGVVVEPGSVVRGRVPAGARVGGVPARALAPEERPPARGAAGVGPALPPEVSVIVATYNRGASAARLLRLLAEQTLAPERFEVVVVDDGSTPPAREALGALLTPGGVPYRLRLVEQANGGPAAARHTAIAHATAPLLVIVDDDMRVGPDFLAQHLAAHPPGSRRVALGRLRAEPGVRLRLHEQAPLATGDALFDAVARGAQRVRGTNLYTGNVSLPRADYEAVGGFDRSFRLSEDAELGVRLERAGVAFGLAPDAVSWHASDHASLAGWMRRSHAYGAADARVAAKHPDVPDADPWRFLFLVNPVSRPLLLLAALAPGAMRPVAWAAARVGMALDALRARPVALAAITLAYGVQYFRGVREQAGGRRAALGGLRRHLNAARAEALPPVGRVLKCAADVCEDHDAIRRTDAKYKAAPKPARLLPDLVQKIGFQMMVAYRVMRLLRDLRLTLLAKIASRAIRHLYAAELHWDAELAPGVVLVHGTGLVVGHAARVGPGCILFQHVTLGESVHPERREVGTPTLEPDVHVGPGATLLGPITVGRESKVAANAVLMRDVPARSLVEPAGVVVRPRRAPGAFPATPAEGEGA
jgi:serine acetyltransferase/GT2 family glycosyltransferase